MSDGSNAVENIDYQLIPGDDDTWNIRILKGKYIETVFSFGELRLEDDDVMSFNTNIISHQFDEDYNFHKDLEWQKYSGDILISVMERAIIDK
tara:strand:+ start:3470 stop:3748 length:279 start_codon:yes stop_codon:yes gene_type:complete